eukprot:TRINITY_DN8977_c0_g1_i1.p1 TRINITY_DN8977_c0_g1~~TRINITY_DN8977_c0_g1_i1.p1  ORF type:complete len:573 (-),score=148.32 TRINITY_DN8977_c0_g1_i1:100-1818(-)
MSDADQFTFTLDRKGRQRRGRKNEAEEDVEEESISNKKININDYFSDSDDGDEGGVVKPSLDDDDDEEEERDLEREVFADIYDESFSRALDAEGEDDEDDEDDLEDDEDEDVDASESTDDSDTKQTDQPKAGGKRRRQVNREWKAAWHDDDDDQLVVDVANNKRLRKLRRTEQEEELGGATFADRLKEQFKKVNPEAAWADPDFQRKCKATDSDSEDDDEDDDEDGDSDDENIIRSTSGISSRAQTTLPPRALNVTRLKDANIHGRSQAVVQSVRFHPNGQLLMAAGLDKTVRLFQVDGKHNPNVQNVVLRDLPINTAFFTKGGDEIVCTGRRKFFYVYDIASGRPIKVNGIKGRQERGLATCLPSPDGQYITFLANDGYILLVSQRSKQLVASMKMNGSVRSAAFSPDGAQLYSAGDEGRVYVWDVKSRRCMYSFVDEGSIRTTAMAISPKGDVLAAGSESGVVNLYDINKFRSNIQTPAPTKALLNLTTSVSSLRFNHDGQVLSMSSVYGKDSLKLVHTSSRSVFSNWPTSGTPLGYVSSTDFSPHSGMMAHGNDKGRVLLYRLNHFQTV